MNKYYCPYCVRFNDVEHTSVFQCDALQVFQETGIYFNDVKVIPMNSPLVNYAYFIRPKKNPKEIWSSKSEKVYFMTGIKKHTPDKGKPCLIFGNYQGIHYFTFENPMQITYL